MLAELSLAVMAWRKSKKFKRAEQSATGVGFKVRMRWERRHGGDLPGPWFDAWLEIEAEGSDSVFIHHVEAVGAHFGSTHQAIFHRWEDLKGGQSFKPLDGEDLPRRLSPGDGILFKNPWWTYTPDAAPKAWAVVQIHSSTNRASPPPHRIDTVPVSLVGTGRMA